MVGIPDLKKAAKRFGATVENDSSGYWRVFQVLAPAGKAWACDPGLHMIKVEWPYGDSALCKEATIKDAIERINYGVEDCSNIDCDYCHAEEE